MTTRRLLLIEFTTVDRFHCAIMFPYLKGLANRGGLKTRWLRFAMKASAPLERDTVGVPLDEEDLAELGAAVDDFEPDRVLFGHRPAAAVIEALEGSGPRPDLAYLADFDESDGSEAVGCRRVDEHDATLWLGLKPPEIRLPEVVDPDFGWETGNALAAEARPLPFLVCGPECSYSRPVQQNPAFDEVDLAGCANVKGCTFCRSERGVAAWGVAPMEMARKNLEAVRETHPRWTHRPRYRITGEGIFFEVDQLARLILELKLEPCDLLLDARADRIVRFAPRLEQAVTLLAGTGHVLHICLVGLENFSAPELLRMNKGLTATQLVQAVDLLLRLEADHPDSFGLREYGGFSTILSTPWTTLDDLWLNLEMVTLFGLERLCGKLLTSRLRLYPELPLAHLARRDGLLVDAYSDPALDTARRNFYPGEMPWRFAHPQVELANRVTTRLQPDAALEGDELCSKVQVWFESLPTSSAVRAASHLVAALRADSSISSVARLMEVASDMAHGRRRPLHMVTGVESMATDDILLEKRWTPASAMMRLGRKPVRKEEPLTRQQVEALEASGDHQKLPNLRFRQRRRTRDGEPVFEMFYGEDPALVQEACELTDQLEDTERYLDQKPALAARIGVLLGYPRCCSEAFSRELLAGWERNEWIHLSRRLEMEGEVPLEMNPFRHLFFVPCKADCPVALELVHEILADRDRQHAEPDRQRWEVDARLPVLFLLNRPGQFVQLAPLEPPQSDRISYRADRLAGDDPRLQDVMRGDTLEVNEGSITVLKGGQKIQTFALEAAIWWHQRSFHPEFWRPVVERLLQSGQSDKAEADETGEAATPGGAAADQTPVARARRAGELTHWASQDDLVDMVNLAWSTCQARETPVAVEVLDPPSEPHATRLALGDGEDRLVLRIEGRRLARGAKPPLVHYNIFTEPTGRALPRRKRIELIRALAALLDSRTRLSALAEAEEGSVSPEQASVLHRRVERAAQILGVSLGARGIACAWPVAWIEDKVLLSLRGGRAWIDLYLEQRRHGGKYFMVTPKSAISYFAHSPLNARKERVVRALARVLERLE